MIDDDDKDDLELVRARLRHEIVEALERLDQPALEIVRAHVAELVELEQPWS
jgi:hypothetical protein